MAYGSRVTAAIETAATVCAGAIAHWSRKYFAEKYTKSEPAIQIAIAFMPTLKNAGSQRLNSFR